MPRVHPALKAIDTVFAVSSCNADFNVARLERYVALAFRRSSRLAARS
ncbi:MAG: hypothetical protein ACE368_13335 [Paracoccaceae bacterium]